MLINGKTLTDNIVPNTLYLIRKRREISFIEPQKDDVGDEIKILYELKDDEYGVFAKEYRPGFINKYNCKKADILILVIDEIQKKFSSWILDVKVSLGGEDTIFHLLEQLCDSYKHKNSLASYLSDYEEQEHIGFITRDYQTERIRNEIASREEYILREKENMSRMSSTAKIPVQIQLLKKFKELEVLQQFLDGYIEINGTQHTLDAHFSIKTDEENYVCNLNVSV